MYLDDLYEANSDKIAEIKRKILVLVKRDPALVKMLLRNNNYKLNYLELAKEEELANMLFDVIRKNNKIMENLRKWFKEKWVRFGPDGKIRGDCARGDDSEGKPKCLPQSRAHALGKKGRKTAANRKRREDPNPERSGPAINVKTKESQQSVAEDFTDDLGYIYAMHPQPEQSEQIAFRIFKDSLDPTENPQPMDEDEFSRRWTALPDPYQEEFGYDLPLWDAHESSGYSNLVEKDKTFNEYVKLVGDYIKSEELARSSMSKMKKGVAESTEPHYDVARYIDEFGDGDHWYIKGSPDTIKRFVQLANSLEDEAVKGTDYEPGVGGMAKIHKQLGNDQPPQWQIVPAQNLEELKPIDNKILAVLMKADLSAGTQEFMSDFLWNLESNGQAVVHGDLEEGVSEDHLIEACWKGYHKEGMKTMFGKRYPNCVKNTNEDLVETMDPAAVRRIQNLLNKKFGANLDVDGILGPLTIESIKKFLPKSAKKLAPIPDKNTAVQGLQSKKHTNENTKRCPECGGPAYSDRMLAEKQDACYHKVKSRYKVWPSAYASGALVQCRKKGAANWGNKSESISETKVYFSVPKSLENPTELTETFKFKQDRKGWYLTESQDNFKQYYRNALKAFTIL